MKRSSSRIREEITRLQEQLKLAEAKEAERIGRLALKAGLGDVSVDDAAILKGFEEMAKRFQGKQKPSASDRASGAQAETSDA
ncbi:TraC family protein [Pelagibacterium halotolerans]|uniref:TraC family protein n=1 Tax=Pelagibacterium halotolerans TaxID=531813 RepID=UPI00384BAF0B